MSDVFQYIKNNEMIYQTSPITVAEGYEWNMFKHNKLTTLYLNSIYEMKAFPNGANDDILDSLAHQLKFAERPMTLYDEFYQTNKQEVNEAR